jgi:four helix bundle protein
MWEVEYGRKGKMQAQSFEDLEVWQHAHRMVLDVYRLTGNFPKHELFGLTSQLRRAAVSVPANIAEGFKKRGVPDKVRYYNIAQGSLEEFRYYFILIRDLGYGDTQSLMQQADSVGRLLNAYVQAILRK